MEALGEASSHSYEKAGGDSFGGTELVLRRSQRAFGTELLIRVLSGAWGSPPGRSAARIFYPIWRKKRDELRFAVLFRY